MTRRERLERKLEKREEWAGKARGRAAARFDAAHDLSSRIPMGQPILVGHHSERRARKDAERITGNMSKGCEESDLAAHHAGKAAGLERQLDRSVFSDDEDAIEKLRERIADGERQAELQVAVNKAWRKGGRAAVAAIAGDKVADQCAETMRLCPWLKSPLDATNLRASIRRDKERIAEIETRQARTAAADAAPGGVLVEDLGPVSVFDGAADSYVRVTFPEKPDRAVLEALRAAGFRWGGGSWVGRRSKLPAELAPAAPELPPCAASMGCLCAGHARGNPPGEPCDTREVG